MNIYVVLYFAALIAVFFVIVVLRRRRRPQDELGSSLPPDTTTSIDPNLIVAQIRKTIVSQQSLVWGALISLGLAAVIDVAIGGFVLSLLGMNNFFGHIVVIFTITALNFLWGLENVLEGWRAAILILGNRRIKMNGQGLSEGYQWVQRPIMKLRPVDTQEKSLDISDEEGAYSKDGVLMSTNAFLRYRIYDIYVYIGIADAVESLRRLAKQTMRNRMKIKSAVDLRNANKVTFSDEIAQDLEVQLAAKGNPGGIKWGLDSGVIIVDDIWATDPGQSKAWGAKAREEAEGEAEQIQAERRLKQLDLFISRAIDPNLAIAVAQVEVEKPGAKVNTVNIPGLEKAIGSIADGINKALTAALNGGKK